ncbi:MAG: type II toxin-antitoxin system prevent-host-death family antitoxin [Bacillota bacterium]|nr:type II toxin-antitoxin system prevent-host-death family antitoxin [Bacillota bacterium]
MEEVGVRKIKVHLSQYLRRVKQGESLIITERGIPVARLVPIKAGLPTAVDVLIQNGLASWRGGKPKGSIAPPPVVPGHAVADAVAEDRR